MAIQGTVDEEALVRGDTLRSLAFPFVLNGSPANIASATFSIRDSKGELLRTTPCTVVGNVVTRPQLDEDITKKWPLGLLTWSIKIKTADGDARTWIKGSVRVSYSDQP